MKWMPVRSAMSLSERAMSQAKDSDSSEQGPRMKKGTGPPTGTWPMLNGSNVMMRWSSVFGGGLCGLEQGAQILQRHGEKLGFGFREIAAGFAGKHFERVDHRLSGAEVHRFFTCLRVGDLTEKKPGVLCLEQDKFVEAWICLGGFWHGRSLQPDSGGGKRKAVR